MVLTYIVKHILECFPLKCVFVRFKNGLMFTSLVLQLALYFYNDPVCNVLSAWVKLYQKSLYNINENNITIHIFLQMIFPLHTPTT